MQNHQTANHKNQKEESIICFVACDDMSEMIEELVINEKKEHSFVSFRKKKVQTRTKFLDHNTLKIKIKASWKKKQPVRRVVI